MSYSVKSQVTKDQGTYALVLYLPQAKTILIGSLGRFKFPRGYYMYIGSAMNGLTARIARHLVKNRLASRGKYYGAQAAVGRWRERQKKMHWHIDYLLEHARVTEVMTHAGTDDFECLWAQAALALPKAKIIAPRFGASDCSCATHLVYFGNRSPEEIKDEH